ncbi:hypothetical protein Mapa_014094 [Marchantia paleacea]|nr:hypothetical protein Mapa_014094 [Marchantia paleacea]
MRNSTYGIRRLQSLIPTLNWQTGIGLSQVFQHQDFLRTCLVWCAVKSLREEIEWQALKWKGTRSYLKSLRVVHLENNSLNGSILRILELYLI